MSDSYKGIVRLDGFYGVDNGEPVSFLGLNLLRGVLRENFRTRTRDAAQLRNEKPIFNECILTNRLKLQPGYDLIRMTGVQRQISCSFLVR
jgi:hypothetical protein